MAYCKELTKQMLIDMGIEVSNEKDEKGNYKIFRTWRTSRNAPITKYQIKYFLDGKYNKWSENTMYYYKVEFSYKRKSQIFSIHRLYFAWFNGCAPKGMVIDHIDNNTFNNDIKNLQPLTYKESIEKRSGHKCKYTTEKWRLEHENSKNK